MYLQAVAGSCWDLQLQQNWRVTGTYKSMRTGPCCFPTFNCLGPTAIDPWS